jgi:SAM-dependent methyltransferase
MKPVALAEMVIRALVPFAPALRAAKRRLKPPSETEANCDYTVTNGLSQLAALAKAGVEVNGKVVLEFGTGWLPIIPMMFHMAGACRIVLTDIERLMDAHTTGLARAAIMPRIDEIASALGQPRETLAARLDGFAPEYLVPWQADRHPRASVDLVTSRATFEHVPREALESFLRAFHNILRPGGAMCHLIDNSDHWQHKDRSLSRVDCLRYPDGSLIWRLAQINPQAYQNRLRHSDYRAMFAGAGFELLYEFGTPDPKCLADLRALPLAARFATYAPEDLAILTSLFVLRKPGEASV